MIRLCLITDRTALGTGPGAIDAVVELARDAALAGIDLIQVREKDLSARASLELSRRVVDAASAGSARVVVNGRFDVALAAGAHGVHLTTSGMDAALVRSSTPSGFVIGVSTHSLEEVRAVEGTADYVVCGPVLPSPLKTGAGTLGFAGVTDCASRSKVPVYALGGIDESTAKAFHSKISVEGVAAIRLFQSAWLEGGRKALSDLVRRIRSV